MQLKWGVGRGHKPAHILAVVMWRTINSPLKHSSENATDEQERQRKELTVPRRAPARISKKPDNKNEMTYNKRWRARRYATKENDSENDWIEISTKLHTMQLPHRTTRSYQKVLNNLQIKTKRLMQSGQWAKCKFSERDKR